MNDNDIIKALEDIVRTAEEIQQCSIAKFVPVSNIKLALDLINRQKAEIERYKGVIKILEKDVAEAKSEAIKEFAERLKDKTQWDVDIADYVFVRDIDTLVKEMVGEK